MKAQFHMIGMLLGVVASLFIVIAMATTGWLTFRDAVKIGLFQYCTPNCNFYSPDGAQAACRFLVVVGFLLCLAATIDAALYYVRFVLKDQENRTLPLISGIFYIVSGVGCLFGAIIWAAKVKADLDPNLNLGYSFGLDVVGSLIAIAAGCLVMVQRSRGLDA